MLSKDAVRWRWLGFLLLLCGGVGAKHVTPNFEVEAPTAAIAEKVALTAERCREELSLEWLGYKLPNWHKPCQVRVKVGQIGAGGATTFSFGGGQVFGWDMTVQGSLERILDSVIPHEVSHTIFACHFRRPLPRWADEGAATLAEEDSERRRQQKLAEEVMPSKRRIPLRELLSITEYPKNIQHVLTLYAEGFALADFLVQKGGKSRFLAFMQGAHESGWDASLRRHYEEENVEALESKWSQWVIAGSPSLRRPDGELLADAKSPSIVRSQNPEMKVAASRTKTTESNRGQKSDGIELASAAAGHSVVPRSESVVAPEPRGLASSRSRSNVEPASRPAQDDEPEQTPLPSPFRVVLSSEDQTSATLVADKSPSQFEPRRLRGPHLIPPELRRPHQPSSIDRDDHRDDQSEVSPSPFAPIETASSPRPKSTGGRVNPAIVQPASLRRK